MTETQKTRIWKCRTGVYATYSRLHVMFPEKYPTATCPVCKKEKETLFHVTSVCEAYAEFRTARHNRALTVIEEKVCKSSKFRGLEVRKDKEIPEEVWEKVPTWFSDGAEAREEGEMQFYHKPKIKGLKTRPDLLLRYRGERGEKKAVIFEWKVPGESRRTDVLTGPGEAEDKYRKLRAVLRNGGYETRLVLAQLGTLGYVPKTLQEDLQGLGLTKKDAQDLVGDLHKSVTKDMIQLLQIRQMRVAEEEEKAKEK
jgi:hypothetical protein